MRARSRATRVSGMVSIMLSFGLIVAAVEVGSVHAASTDPAVVGQWTAPTTMPFVGIHSMVMRNGSVLLFDRSLGNRGSPGVLFNPTTGAMVDVRIPYPRDVFCAGHNILPDGSVLVTGGHPPVSGHPGIGVNLTDVFNPIAKTWTPGPTMDQARWYPSNVSLGDGTTLIFSGNEVPGDPVLTVDRYDPATGQLTTLPATANRKLTLYPKLHLMANGKLFLAGASRAGAWFDPDTATWSAAPRMIQGRKSFASVVLPDQRVMAIGGTGPKSSAEIVDLSAANPAWKLTAPMHFGRTHPNAVLLPDGKVFVVGGGTSGEFNGPVLTPELYDPAANTWTDMAPQQAQRMYHGTAVLLPDGRVLSAGSNYGPLQKTYEIYSPPYLFAGTRPVISAAPTNVGYGQTFQLTSGNSEGIAKVVLMHPGSSTHSLNLEQRALNLSFTKSGSTITATLPANGDQAVPGWYMVFLVSDSGVPSVASWVRLS